MNWLKSTDNLQPGAYYYRLEANAPIWIVTLVTDPNYPAYEKHRLTCISQNWNGNVSMMSGEFLPISSLLEHQADLERRLVAIEHCLRNVPTDTPNITADWLPFEPATASKPDLSEYYKPVTGSHESDSAAMAAVCEHLNKPSSKPASGKPKSGAEWRERHGKSPKYWPANATYAWGYPIGEECGFFDVPKNIWDALACGKVGKHWREYQSKDIALAALDAALLACGEIEPEPAKKEAVGLMALVEKWRREANDNYDEGTPQCKLYRELAAELEAALQREPWMRGQP